MMTKEEYKKTLIRIWDTARIDDKGTNGCSGIECKRCPVASLCGNSTEIAYELIEFVEKWAKEHPIETNGSRFLKNYPKAVLYGSNNNGDGFIFVRLDVSKPFEIPENCIKIPRIWWESEVADAGCD